MGLHNNVIGHKVSSELFDEAIRNFTNKPLSVKEINNLIAEKIIKRMNNGELVLKPGNKPSKPKKIYPTGFAAGIGDSDTSVVMSSAQRLEARLQKEWAQSAAKKENARTKFDETKSLKGYVNEVSKSERIFTEEEIDRFSKKQMAEHHSAIEYQRKKIGIPSKKQVDKAVSSGGMVYVGAYVRGDGVQVGSYYRSKPHG